MPSPSYAEPFPANPPRTRIETRPRRLQCPAVVAMKVRYPHMREIAVGTVESLADRDFQQRVWIDGASTTRWYTWSFTETYNWLFENTTAAEDPFGCIGFLLRDETEARAMGPLKEAVDRLHDALGYNGRTDNQYLTSPLWDAVVLAARVALEAMCRPDSEVARPARRAVSGSRSDRRRTIVSAVEHLSDRNYQQHAWVEGGLPYPAQDSFPLAYNGLFVDIPVMDDPFAWVGDVLRDPAEARALLPLKRAVDRLHTELGYNRIEVEYLASPLWADVLATAGNALAVLRRPDADTDMSEDFVPFPESDLVPDDEIGSGPDTAPAVQHNGVSGPEDDAKTGTLVRDHRGLDIPLAPAAWSGEATATIVSDPLPEQDR